MKSKKTVKKTILVCIYMISTFIFTGLQSSAPRELISSERMPTTSQSLITPMQNVQMVNDLLYNLSSTIDELRVLNQKMPLPNKPDAFFKKLDEKYRNGGTYTTDPTDNTKVILIPYSAQEGRLIEIIQNNAVQSQPLHLKKIQIQQNIKNISIEACDDYLNHQTKHNQILALKIERLQLELKLASIPAYWEAETTWKNMLAKSPDQLNLNTFMKNHKGLFDDFDNYTRLGNIPGKGFAEHYKKRATLCWVVIEKLRAQNALLNAELHFWQEKLNDQNTK